MLTTVFYRWKGRGALVLALALGALLVGSVLPAWGAPSVQEGTPAPHVFDTDPLAGQELALQQTVSFFFDVPMDPVSTEAAFSVQPQIAGELDWSDDGLTLFFIPAVPFQRATTYTFTIGAEAQSAQGVALGEPFTLSLQTVGYLEVAEVLPAPDSEEVEADSVITVIFNRPVVPLLMAEDTGGLPDPLRIEPSVEGKGEWLNTSIYLFTPSEGLAGGTTYTVTVAAGLEDVTGGVLQQDYTWQFTTVAPRVLEISPRDQAEDVPIDTEVTITFSQPMDTASVESAFEFISTDASEQPVQGAFAWNEDATVLTFRPTEPLEMGTLYSVGLDVQKVRSATGAALADETAFALFTTEPYPAIRYTEPEDGETVEPSGQVRIAFNTPMNPESFEGKILLDPMPAEGFEGTYYNYDRAYHIAFQAEPQTTYTVTVLPGIEDTRGNPITESYSWSFYVTDYEPSLSLEAPRVGVYNAYSPTTRLFVLRRNVSQLEAQLWRLPLSTLADLTGPDAYSTWEAFTPHPQDMLRRWAVPLSEARNQSRYELLYVSIQGTEGTAGACMGAPAPRVKLGDAVRVSKDDPRPLNVRAAPSLQADVIVQLNPGLTMRIIGGPTCEAGYVWWQVSLEDGRIGWVAEGEAELYYIEPLDLVPPDPNSPQSAQEEAVLPPALPPGAYYLEVNAPELPENTSPRRTVLVVQSANIALKFSTTSALAWVTDMQSGAPLAGLPVQFYDEHFQPLGQAVTDADGLATLPIGPLDYLYTTLYALVQTDEHFAFTSSRWDDGIESWSFDLSADYSLPDHTIYLYTDRPIYRPGQPVYFKGIVRAQNDTYFTIMDAEQVRVNIYDDQGELIFDEWLPLTPQGSFSGELALAEDASLGYYTLSATLSETEEAQFFSVGFSVAEYRAPEFQVDVLPQQDEVVQGDTIQVLVESRYYFGGAVSGARVEYSVLADSYYFHYRGDQPGYWSFDDVDYDLFAPYYYGAYAEPIAEGEGTTDADGRFMIELPADLGEEGHSQTYTIEARVIDESDRMVAGRAQVVVHQGLIYVGLQPEDYIGFAGQESAVNVLAVDWESAPLANQEVRYRVVKREWYNVQEEDEYGNTIWTWDVKEEPLEGGSGTLTTDADGLAQLRFTPPSGGVYKIYASATDARGNQVRASAFMWVSGREYVSWRQENSNRIQLITDKDEYAVGDTAQILIPSPWQGQAYALVTVERGDVLSHEVITLESNSTVYELPIAEDYAPNVFVSVTLVKGVDETNPTTAFRMGLVNLPVDTSHLVMDLEVTPSVDVAAGEFAGPGDEVDFTVRTTDWQGEPVSGAEVGVSMSDLAVLSIAASNSPDLLPFFYYERGLAVRTANALTVSVDQMTQTIIDTVKGGGGGMGGPAGLFEVRQEFVDTPLWLPHLVTDANGEVRFSVTLPDNLTTWRLDVRAVTSGRERPMLVGQTTFDLLSTKPVLIRPGTPRFFVVGDQATLAAVVNNNTDADVQAVVSLQGTGFRFANGVEPSQEVTVPAKGRARVDWAVEIGDVTEVDAVFSVSADGGRYTDASKPTVTQGAPIPVYKYQVPETVGTAGVLSGPQAGSRTEAIVLPRRFEVSDGELTVRLDRSLAAATADGLTWLQNYPYLCTEQVISRFLPNIVTLRALQRLGVDDAELQANLEEAVNQALQRLYSQQKADGGWGWFAADESSPLVTAYALIGLSDAREYGIPVEEATLQRAAQFVRGALITPRGQEPQWRLNRQAFLLYALARAGYGNYQQAVLLFDYRENMNLDARAYLALTFHLITPNDNYARELVNDLNNALVVSATGAHWEESAPDRWNWSTDTRTTALGLLALTQIDPQNQLLPNVVRWLMVARQGDHWETTQETAWAVMALAEWMVLTDELHPSYTFAVALNGEKVALADDTATPQNVREREELTFQVADLLRGQANRLTVSRTEGEGNLYYTAHLRAYLPVSEVQPLDRGVIVRRTYTLADDADETPITAAQVGQTVRVTLTLIVPNAMHYVVVEDPLPAGADAVNPQLLTESQVSTQPRITREQPLSSGWGWWYFSTVEMRDEKVVFYAPYLPAGTYELTYILRPSLAGVYNVIPPTAQEFYFPEVYGRGAGVLFTITDAEER